MLIYANTSQVDELMDTLAGYSLAVCRLVSNAG